MPLSITSVLLTSLVQCFLACSAQVSQEQREGGNSSGPPKGKSKKNSRIACDAVITVAEPVTFIEMKIITFLFIHSYVYTYMYTHSHFMKNLKCCINTRLSEWHNAFLISSSENFTCKRENDYKYWDVITNLPITCSIFQLDYKWLKGGDNFLKDLQWTQNCVFKRGAFKCFKDVCEILCWH